LRRSHRPTGRHSSSRDRTYRRAPPIRTSTINASPAATSRSWASR
jgi:hypothetical protein